MVSPKERKLCSNYQLIQTLRLGWYSHITTQKFIHEICYPLWQWLTVFPIGKMPNILKHIFPSLSPLHKTLNRWWEEFDSSSNESSPSSMKPLSPDTNPGIRGTFGAGGKKREVLSSYFEVWQWSSCKKGRKYHNIRKKNKHVIHNKPPFT
jgi:hypothetical protein